jgi:hypothetical protein
MKRFYLPYDDLFAYLSIALSIFDGTHGKIEMVDGSEHAFMAMDEIRLAIYF